MQERQLRIVKEFPPPAMGVCERCNAQFKSDNPESQIIDITAQFEAHKCKPVDSSQNADGPIPASG
jgi:hypothetical protein